MEKAQLMKTEAVYWLFRLEQEDMSIIAYYGVKRPNRII
jgi:hypothetical protein